MGGPVNVIEPDVSDGVMHAYEVTKVDELVTFCCLSYKLVCACGAHTTNRGSARDAKKARMGITSIGEERLWRIYLIECTATPH